jgi:hypothetical protein
MLIKMSNMDITNKYNTEIYKWATWTSPKHITQKYIKMSNMDITKKHSTEIFYIFLCYVFWWCPCCSSLYISVFCVLVMFMSLIFIYFCVMFFGDVHVAHLYIFLCYVFWWCRPCYITQKYIKMSNMDDTKNIAQKYIKMTNMDITKKHCTEIYKDENMDITKKHNTEICPCCSSLYISVLCVLVMSMLLIFIYFCAMFFGDVHVAHLYIFLWQKYIKMSNMDITKKHSTEIYKDEEHGHRQKT